MNDIYTSPVIPKLMPTLRHTKSEERLDSNADANSNLDASNDKTKMMLKPSDSINEFTMTEDDVWSQEDDEITAQYLNLHKPAERDSISQISMDSYDSREQGKH